MLLTMWRVKKKTVTHFLQLIPPVYDPLGLGDFQFALSAEPELGEWSVKVLHNVTETQSFQVKEYGKMHI